MRLDAPGRAPRRDGRHRAEAAPLDTVLLVIYFVFVIGIGFALKRAVRSSTDFFLSGRSLPPWITGLAFVSANLGAIEILGQAASGAQYGAATVHYYWIGAIPAMVFLGIVMMPFYYGSKVRSVPEYLRLRYDAKAHLINAITFVLSSVLIAGVNLFALATVVEALLGIPLWVAIVLSAAFVLSLHPARRPAQRDLQRGHAVLRDPRRAHPAGVRLGAQHRRRRRAVRPAARHRGGAFVSAWQGTGIGGDSPLGDWFGIVAGLGFCLGFGYWTTNFAEVQRAMSARNEAAARLTPIIAAIPKAFIPLVVVLPGMAAAVIFPKIGEDPTYTNAIPALMAKFLPPGVLGVAVTGLVAAFMAGMAANVGSFNAVFTYDIYQDYIKKDEPDLHYLRIGRVVTVAGVVIGIGTAFIATQFSNISNYIQVLFSFFNVPLFTAFIIGMFWKRASRSAGFWGILVGTIVSVGTYALYKTDHLAFRSDLQESLLGLDRRVRGRRPGDGDRVGARPAQDRRAGSRAWCGAWPSERWTPRPTASRCGSARCRWASASS
ncbi:sodium:solute symporter [Angustibacter aerolatus]|uniref:Sodium:solute symporter n=1 Tax=Angustibacter aerolatus TaxID=1162965 RepID=A0ABQ6JP08_9ACTN|nr:sodium:solute symporter family protein [Angustibacter aerolatus]GMA89311.1 sodium:solute symporter [Angustibacter aerolatus]